MEAPHQAPQASELLKGWTAPLDEQIARYRRMNGEQRLVIALALHELACDVARGIRTRRSDADDLEVERQLRSRIALSYEPRKPHREDPVD